MLKDLSFWFSIITAVVAIIALFQTSHQMKLSNKQYLFERRLCTFMTANSLILSYESNTSILEGTYEDELDFVVDDKFIRLTNNSYMEKQQSAIKNPLKEPYHSEFLRKREELKNMASEIRLIFNGKESIIYSNFVLCYVDVLFKMYQYQIIINKILDRNKENPDTIELWQKRYPSEKTQRQELYSAIENMKKSYLLINEKNVQEKIEKQIGLK